MNRCVLNLMIVLLSTANIIVGMERFAKFFSCMNPDYSKVNTGKKIDENQQAVDQLNDISQTTFSIDISRDDDPKQITIQRFLNKNNNNRWRADYEYEADKQVIDIRSPTEKILDNVPYAQHFDIIGKKPGTVTVILSEVKKGRNVHVVRKSITIVK